MAISFGVLAPPTSWRGEEPLALLSSRTARRRQAVHLPLHVRRPLARRHVRSEAAPAGGRRRSPLPFEKPKLEHTKTGGNLLGSPWKFQKYGQSGTEVSELFPHISGCVDDLCVIRSMVADNINHNGACLQMNTGEQAFSRPSLGSWLLYGLGSENQESPRLCGHQSVAAGAGRPALGFQLSAGRLSRHAGGRFKESDCQFAKTARQESPVSVSSISSGNSSDTPQARA